MNYPARFTSKLILLVLWSMAEPSAMQPNSK